MVEFSYSYIAKDTGERVGCLELKEAIEREWPGHQQEIARELRKHDMGGWTVRFRPEQRLLPEPEGGGYLIPSMKARTAATFKWLGIIQHSRYQMRATLYHEILHHDYPEWTEEKVEEETNYRFPVLEGIGC